MGGTQPLTRLSVEVLVEEQEILPVGIGGIPRITTVTRAVALFIGQEDGNNPFSEQPCGLAERHHVSRAGRKLNLEGVAVEVIVGLERLDDHEVDRHPDRTSPVGISAEHPGLPLPRLIPDGIDGSIDRVGVGVLLVEL